MGLLDIAKYHLFTDKEVKHAIQELNLKMFELHEQKTMMSPGLYLLQANILAEEGMQLLETYGDRVPQIYRDELLRCIKFFEGLRQAS